MLFPEGRSSAILERDRPVRQPAHACRRKALAYIRTRLYICGRAMTTARVFKSGNSQAVRLPKEFRVKGDEVEIFRRGNEIVLLERPRGMEQVVDILAGLPDDFLAEEPEDLPPQAREGL